MNGVLRTPRRNSRTATLLVVWMAVLWSAGCAGKPIVVTPALPLPSQPLEAAKSGDQARRVDLGDLLFDFNQPTLRGGAKETLETVAQVMKSDATWTVRVEGHADDLGSAEEHQALSLQRAKAVEAHLVGLGIEYARITVVSHGDLRRRCSQPREDCRQQNRRVHLTLVTTQEAP